MVTMRYCPDCNKDKFDQAVKRMYQLGTFNCNTCKKLYKLSPWGLVTRSK